MIAPELFEPCWRRAGCNAPVGCQARASHTGWGLCRSDRRLPLYGASPADTGEVPTSAGRVGCMVADGSRLPTVSTTVKLGTNATNSNTNKPNKDHPVPLGATQDHQSTTKRPVKFPVTPHALKLPDQAQAEIGAANQAHEVQWEGPPQSWSRRRCGPSRPRRWRAALRSTSLDRLAPS
jgi:hypothetical protein